MVHVPVPKQDQEVAREFSAGMMSVIGGTSLPTMSIVAAAFTIALVVPKVGVAVAGLVMVMGFSAYGDIIRRAGEGPDQTDLGWKKTLLPGTPLQALLCTLMAAGTVVPLWFLGSGERNSPHWSVVGLLIGGLSWTVLPIALFLTRSGEGETPLGWRRAGRMLARHPIATVLALALVPYAYVLIEASFGLLVYVTGYLPYFTLDYMPMHGDPVLIDGIPHFGMIDYRYLNQSLFHQWYLWGIRHGYTFIGSIPASLSNPTRGGLSPDPLNLNTPIYAGLRVGITWLFLLCLISAVAIQARWLGSLPLIERKRPGR